ncbi:hypothetical protein IPM62_02160 [Candidatus Woesebacteria bacterium]|nr:MAG: hypothetical protein IPM62_02160 [Candidatus Woesebacteria bacterium]
MADITEENILNVPEGERKKLIQQGVPYPGRRRFLQFLPSVGAAVVLAACGDETVFPTPAPVANADKGLILPTATPDTRYTTESKEFNNLQETHFVSREGVDTFVHTLGWKTPLKPHELEIYINSRKETDLPENSVRTPEIFVGHEAFKMWQDGLNADGEQLLPFLEYHFRALPNKLLAGTRPENGINGIRMDNSNHPIKVIVVDEQWLQNYPGAPYGSVTSIHNSKDVYARYLIPKTYNPTSGGFLAKDPDSGKVVDTGLIHEQTHHTLYNNYHLLNYYLRLENWTSYPTMPRTENIGSGNIMLWKLSQSQKHLLSHHLSDWKYYFSGESPLSPQEELVVHRSVFGDENMASPLESQMSFWDDPFIKGELSDKYTFTGSPGASTARLYPATLDEKTGYDNFKWNFDVDPIPLNVSNGVIELDTTYLEGNIGLSTSPETQTVSPRAFLLVVGEGDQKRVYGFTSCHLLHWHYKEQRAHNAKLGAQGQNFPVNINLADFES